MKKISHLIMASADIGNVEDLPFRSLEALRNSDMLIFEEDRPARKFLKAAGITRDYYKLNEHKSNDTLNDAKAAFKKGLSVCYMSDQGTACLADPGLELVKLAVQMQVETTVVPGPSSISAAISACPFDCSRFYYIGFTPRKDTERKQFLMESGKTPAALVIMDTPYRLKNLLADCLEVFPKRMASIALDISGSKESFWNGRLDKLLVKAESLTEKLNFVLIIEAPK